MDPTDIHRWTPSNPSKKNGKINNAAIIRAYVKKPKTLTLEGGWKTTNWEKHFVQHKKVT